MTNDGRFAKRSKALDFDSSIPGSNPGAAAIRHRRVALTLCAFTLGLASALWFTRAIDYDCSTCTPLAREIVKSLQEEPHRWSEDKYCLGLDAKSQDSVCQSSTFALWIANGRHFLRPYNRPTNADAWKELKYTPEKDYVWAAYLTWHETRQYEPTLSKSGQRSIDE